MINKVGRRVFYDVRNGNVILVTNELYGHVRPTTVEEDIESFPVLSERNRETFDYIDLDFGQYKEDFRKATSIAVDLDTKEVVFNFEKVDEEPIYQEPLTEKVKRLEKEKEELKIYTAALGQTLTEEKLTNIEKDMLLQGLGQEVTSLKIELMKLKGGE